MVQDESDVRANDASVTDSSNILKQAACLRCRRSKVKCVRAPDAETCNKCLQAGTECEVPSYHVGRYKGVKNKRSGLEKAIHQVEQALKKASSTGIGLPTKHSRALERLAQQSKSTDNNENTNDDELEREASMPQEASRPDTSLVPELRSSTRDLELDAEVPHYPEKPSDVTINNADNPLQLLAMASAIPDNDSVQPSPAVTSYVSPAAPTTSTERGDENETQDFFSPMVSKLDVVTTMDPIDLGLISVPESQQLFSL